jgi:hypothetical protein
VTIDAHQLDILGAIPVLRDNGGRLPERQTDLDVIYREPELQRVRNRDGVPSYKPISFIVGSSIFHIFIATKYGREKLEGVSLRDRFGLFVVLIKFRLEEQVSNQLVTINRDIGNIECDELLGTVKIGMDSRSLLLVEERPFLFGLSALYAIQSWACKIPSAFVRVPGETGDKTCGRCWCVCA